MLAISSPIRAQGYVFPIDIRSGLLDISLKDLMHQTGAELLFDPHLLVAHRSPRVRGRLSVQAALQRLLAGTDLDQRHTRSGVWIIERQLPQGAPAPEELAEPEILVVGHRSQDVDIARRENDIQPYQVSRGEEIVRAHRDNLDEFFRSRITPDIAMRPPALRSSGETNSEIDLRGLGPDQTLILVDGRRLPGIPTSGFSLRQPDINAIPLHAIDRVETLTGTAGGIYGFGGLGGVVNVVLRHDLHGLELHGTTGITARGDARRLDLEGGIGFSPDGGRTEVSAYFGHTAQQPLLEGQRGLALRGREASYRNDPADTLEFLRFNAVTVSTVFNQPLVFKPAYGGATLGSFFTYLPRGFAGTSADLVATLTGNAGKLDLHPTDEENASDLTATPTTSSAIITVRHDFGGGVEAYLDALILRNRGRFHNREVSGSTSLNPGSPLNPFQNTLLITFPPVPDDDYDKIRISSDRYTAGLILPLPFHWKATVEASFGASSYHAENGSLGTYIGPFEIDDTTSPDFNPFGNWAAFQRSQAPYQYDFTDTEAFHNRYREQSLRLAGPAFRTAAGPATLTMLLQNRAEKVPGFALGGASSEDPDPEYAYYGAHSSVTRSAYAELDAPLIADAASFPLLRGLTVQIAARYDSEGFALPPEIGSLDPQELHSSSVHSRLSGTTYTAGAKVLPLPWLLLRGSYATGQQPPTLQRVENVVQVSDDLEFLQDPKRGNAYFDDMGTYTILAGDSPNLTTIHASTLALGVVINPRGVGGPRVSIDYSHIRRRGDYLTLDPDTVLAHEDYWPQRVTRAPLTDADRAKGYTVGAVTMIDARATNGGRLDAEAIDGRLDWTVPAGSGTLHLYGSTTLQLRETEYALFQAPQAYVGFIDGPLRWHANGGGEWTVRRTTIGANVQYYGHYRIASSAEAALGIADLSEDPQGSRYVKAQAYVDLFVSRRFPVHWAGKDRDVSVDLAVVNLFDHAPPYQEDEYQGSMFSPYGDPRMRRFELTLNANF